MLMIFTLKMDAVSFRGKMMPINCSKSCYNQKDDASTYSEELLKSTQQI
jgi:hypothetical protein